MRKVLPIALVVLAAACNSPVQRGKDPGITPSAQIITPKRSGMPLTQGKATTTYQGAFSGTLELKTDDTRSELLPPPKNFKGIWYDAENNILALGGATFNGTRKTTTKEPSLLLTYGFKRGTGTIAFASRQGECSVTMTATESKIEGSYLCESIKPIAGGSQPYRLSGTFTASK